MVFLSNQSNAFPINISYAPLAICCDRLFGERRRHPIVDKNEAIKMDTAILVGLTKLNAVSIPEYAMLKIIETLVIYFMRFDFPIIIKFETNIGLIALSRTESMINLYASCKEESKTCPKKAFCRRGPAAISIATATPKRRVINIVSLLNSL